MVLEPGDGFKLQIIIDGPSNTELTFEGSCIGSPKVRVLPPSWIYFAGRRKRFEETSTYFKALFSVSLALLLFIGLISLITRFLPTSSKYLAIGLTVLFGLLVFSLICGVLYDWYKKLTDTFVPPEIRNG